MIRLLCLLLGVLSIASATPVPSDQCRIILVFLGAGPREETQSCTFTDTVSFPEADQVRAVYSQIRDTEINGNTSVSIASELLVNGEITELRPIGSRFCDGCSDILWAFTGIGPDLQYTFNYAVTAQYMGPSMSSYWLHTNIWTFLRYEPIESQGVPEPSTFGLVAAFMVLLQILIRRGTQRLR